VLEQRVGGAPLKVLIVGGTGLISTAITRALAARGAAVTLFNRGHAEVEVPTGVTVMRGDRKDTAAFERAMAAAGPFDCVIDMICFLPADAESTVRAFGGRTRQLVFCSTVDVYTKPAVSYPVREGAERSPRESFPYAAEKARCERILEQAQAGDAFALTVIRPAYTYGPGRGMLHTFRSGSYYHARIRDGRPVIVHGDGQSLWAAAHRDDVGLAFASAAGNAATFGRAYHVAGEDVVTWNQYHRVVAEAMGAPAPRLVHIPTDMLARAVPVATEWCAENFQFDNIFDNSAAARELGYRYSIGLRQGVESVVRWLDGRGLVSADDEPPWYEPLLAAWERAGDGVTRELAPLEG
jgi:nucleoside-diphosphate-sugar epimerase